MKTDALETQQENDIRIQAKEVLQIEAKGILDLAEKLDSRFEEMVEMVLTMTGRLIVSGIGKSGIVGRKIVATLNSTGTRALFLHPVEAMHGDLGMVGTGDLFLAISNSGETDELNIMVPSIREIGCKVVAFVGNQESTLARHSDLVIDVGVEKEACPLGLAPTASTTAQLAMGDALAVVLISKKHFGSKDFKRYHPGGHLGQRLSGTVGELMLKQDAVPMVDAEKSLFDAVCEIDRSGLGVSLIVDDKKRLCGILTDGDLRRLVANGIYTPEITVKKVMTPDPRQVTADTPGYAALNLMEEYEITVLPVVNEEKVVTGLLHLHDILGKGTIQFDKTAKP